MSPTLYLILHLTGAFALFMASGAAAHHSALGGTKDTNPNHKALSAGHGIALLAILVAGFGLLAKRGYGFPGWVIAKIVIWLCLGALMTPLARAAGSGRVLWLAILLLGVTAAWLGVTRPF